MPAWLTGFASHPFCTVTGWQASPACNKVPISAGLFLRIKGRRSTRSPPRDRRAAAVDQAPNIIASFVTRQQHHLEGAESGTPDPALRILIELVVPPSATLRR